MKLKAYAKVNIVLDVVRKREDGYHEVRMIMQTVDLYDEVELCRTEEPGIRLTVDVPGLPVDEGNLAYRAAKLLLDEFSCRQGVSIRLTKRIPMAAGMAGGSTDAAAVLRGVNDLFELGLSLQELMDRGVKLGADVPYCLLQGTALSEGIGEILTPLPAMPECTLVIAKPDISVSTAFVYGNLHADTLKFHPDVDGAVEAIRRGDLPGVTERMGNVLETVTVREYPVIEEIKECLRSEGAMGALMSGSGPTVFGIFGTKAQAERAKEVLEGRQLAKQLFTAGLTGRSE